MKIVHITPYFPPCKGGIARIVSGFVEHVDAAESVHVISREGKPSEKVSVLNLGKGRFIVKAIELLRKTDPDVVHCHSHWHMLAPALVHRRFHKKAKVLFTFHTEPLELSTGIKSRLFERMLARCDAVTYVSKALRERINSRIRIQTRQNVIYPGVEAATLDEEGLEGFVEEFGTRGRTPLLVFVGLLEWKKKVQGIKILLRAVATVRERHPSIKLLIVGDGSRRGEVEEAISDLNLSDSVTITGLVDDVFIPLSLCDIYVHISLQETLGQSVLEAMSLGKPVIASNIGGMPEIVNDGANGILVEPEEEAVASSIMDLLENRTKAVKLGRQAKEFVERNFSWEKMAEEFQNLYASP